jgi:CRP-like cAMP-binding protein
MEKAPLLSRETLRPQRHKAGANNILNAIPWKEYELLVPHLRPQRLENKQVIYEWGSEITECYFVSDAVISCMQIMKNGDSVEVGLFGSEGFAGHPILVNLYHSPMLFNVQVPGQAVTISAMMLRQILGHAPVLEQLMERFAYLLALQAAQVAGCNGLHEIGQRLARWILMIQDRVRVDSLPLTHDLLAGMLGSRRATVTVAAGAMQKEGIIEYTRGKVRVLKRDKLEENACECYGVVRGQMDAYMQAVNAARSYVF